MIEAIREGRLCFSSDQIPGTWDTCLGGGEGTHNRFANTFNLPLFNRVWPFVFVEKRE